MPYRAKVAVVWIDSCRSWCWRRWWQRRWWYWWWWLVMATVTAAADFIRERENNVSLSPGYTNSNRLSCYLLGVEIFQLVFIWLCRYSSLLLVFSIAVSVQADCILLGLVGCQLRYIFDNMNCTASQSSWKSSTEWHSMDEPFVRHISHSEIAFAFTISHATSSFACRHDSCIFACK